MTSSTRPSATPASGPTPPDLPAGPVIRFNLTGQSRPFDARRQAIRSDLADIAEAEFHFAPHYAAPLRCRLTTAASLHAAPGTADRIADLAAATGFAVLDVTGHWAWGYVSDSHAVGYVLAEALAVDDSDLP